MTAVDEAWKLKWAALADSIRNDLSYRDSATQLRSLIKTGLLRFTDMRDVPEKFFLAHRMMVGLRGPGFWIRFTVQYNLFAGTVLGLGGPEQVESLSRMQEMGTLGCFALTEKLAGVNSGLVVQTTATWSPQRQGFILHSPTEGSHKNWISQGLTADKAAVIADLVMNGKSFGPHGFLVDMRNAQGEVCSGITLGDMGRKTTGNDLDNAWIQFTDMFLPLTCLLNRYCTIENNTYVQRGKEKMRIEVIGQRLLTGRVAVAQAALTFCLNLLHSTHKYTTSKRCWSPTGTTFLSDIPHIKRLFETATLDLFHMQTFLLKVEDALSKTLQQDAIPTSDLVQAIAVGKISAVEMAISISFQLKQEVGSYALMGGTGFEDMDFLQCCKFAEGDGRILSQKLARDQVRAFSMSKLPQVRNTEEELCQRLHKGGKDKWDENFEVVYDLAELIQKRVIREWIGQDLKVRAKF